MKPQAVPKKPTQREVKKHTPTIERLAYVNGLLAELKAQFERYRTLVQESAAFQAKIQLSERSVKLTRDHIEAILEATDEEVTKDWKQQLYALRFIGARLGDACMEILEKRGSISTKDLISELNQGQFRFRTTAPLKEINGALLRQQAVTRDAENDLWIYEKKANE